MSSKLAGLRVLVTRPAHQAPVLVDGLKSHGAEVLQLPLLSISPPESWLEFDNAFSNLGEYDWVLFASVNAVESSLSRLSELGISVASLNSLSVAAIGPATARSLTERGISVGFQPAEYVAEQMVAEFPGYRDGLHGVRVLWPKANVGRLLIKTELESAGARVHTVHCYRTAGPQNASQTSARLKDLLLNRQVDVVTLTSSETVRIFHELLIVDGADSQPFLTDVKLAVIGPETAKTAKNLLGRTDIQAREFTIPGLINALLQAQFE